MKYNKLVRDKIPEIIRKIGGEYKIHIAGRKEYWQKLKEKLLEEFKEFSKSETIEEFADIMEVLDAIRDYKFDKRKLEMIKRNKTAERGGFKKRVILEES